MQYLIPWFGNLWIKRIIVIIRKMKQGRILEDHFLWHIFQASFSITTKKEIPTNIQTIINDSIYRFPTASGVFVTDKSNGGDAPRGSGDATADCSAQAGTTEPGDDRTTLCPRKKEETCYEG